MKIVLAGAAIAVLVAKSSGIAGAQERRLDRDDVVRLARENAPIVAVARARVTEARSERVGASTSLAGNPSIRATAGPRWSGGDVTPQLEVGLEQDFALGGGRGARLDAARALLDSARADVGEAERAARLDALTAYVAALEASARLVIVEDTESVARELFAIAERREASGDVSRIDVELARSAAARARAARFAAQADGETARAALGALLGLDEVIAVEGSLEDAPRYELARLLDAASRRADLGGLRAEQREAEARLREGRAGAWPTLTLGAAYESDDRDDLALGTVGLTLPIFDSGAGLRAVSRARRGRAIVAASALRRSIRIELRGLLASYEVHRRALAAAQESVTPLAEAAPLVLRAYQAGESSMAEVLTVRRELLESRGERLDRARELALARLRLEHVAGVTP